MNSSMLNSRWSLPVLTYHRIGPFVRGVEPTITVAPRQFENQLSWLKSHGYQTLTAFHLSEVLKGRAVMPPNPVLLTFDDGYEDLCEYAFPALLANHFNATVFVVTGRLGQINTWDQAVGWSALPLMSADQIRQWAKETIDFGSHSKTHPVLTELSEVELESELSGSAQELSLILGRKATCLAYPHGRHSAVVRSVAARYFDLAFSCEEGPNDANTDRFAIRRTMVRPKDGLRSFSHRVLKGASPVYDLQQWRAQARLRSRFKDILSWFHHA
jgi:peptidoglycan/xylan/chitin deacetylase (PgdA/CDA1 family)